MEMAGITKLKGKSCARISGGELQLVLIARALAAQPEILVLDEPESGLDFRNQIVVLDLLQKLSREQELTVIVNTHYPEHALKISADGTKIAMFLKLTFLEGQGRRDLFKNTPPQTVYVSSARLQCGKNGCFDGTSMVAYAWFVWVKGEYSPTHIKWIN
jgi:ABC-type cobalamin/Fe3+-siderophores transport system ATPase subunit